jgi:hypothetical protein
MKKSLIIVVALVTCLAFAGTVLAWDCYPPAYQYCKQLKCKDQVLCKGKAGGKTKLCGPCAPTISWKASWMTLALCPGSKMLKKKAKRKK